MSIEDCSTHTWHHGMKSAMAIVDQQSNKVWLFSL